MWVADRSGSALFPTLTHGYGAAVLARMTSIPRDADNAAAAAWRLGELRTVTAQGQAPGALVTPIVTAEGCVGVLAAETRNGSEHDEGTRAVSRILAAQLATFVTTVPRRTHGDPPPLTRRARSWRPRPSGRGARHRRRRDGAAALGGPLTRTRNSTSTGVRVGLHRPRRPFRPLPRFERRGRGAGFLSLTYPSLRLAVSSAFCTASMSASVVVTGASFTLVITSPARIPALAAGESFVDARHEHAVLRPEVVGELLRQVLDADAEPAAARAR